MSVENKSKLQSTDLYQSRTVERIDENFQPQNGIHLDEPVKQDSKPILLPIEYNYQLKAQPQITLKYYQNKYMAYGLANFWALSPYVFCVCGVNQFDESVLPLAIQNIMKDFNVSFATAQWVITVYFLGTAVSTIPLAKIAAAVGNVRLTAILLILVFALYLGCFFVNNLIALIMMRFIIGFLTSGFLTTRNVFISHYPSEENKHKSIANTLVLRMSQQVICPIVGGYIVKFGGWRYVMLVSAILTIFSLLLLIMINEAPLVKIKKFDIFGSVLMMVFLAGFALFFTFITEREWLIAGICFIIFVIGLIIFLVIETKVVDPILPLQLMKNPLSTVLFINTMNFTNTLSMQNLIPQVFRLMYHIDEGVVGILTACGAVAGVVATFLNNFLNKRYVSRILLSCAYVLMIVVSIIFLTSFQFEYGAIIVFFMYLFVSMGLQQHTYSLLLTCVNKSLNHYVCGFPPLSRTFGSCFASVVCQSMFQIVQGAGVIDYIYYSGIGIILFQVVFVVVNLCLVMFLLGVRNSEKTKQGFKENWVRELAYHE